MCKNQLDYSDEPENHGEGTDSGYDDIHREGTGYGSNGLIDGYGENCGEGYGGGIYKGSGNSDGTGKG